VLYSEEGEEETIALNLLRRATKDCMGNSSEDASSEEVAFLRAKVEQIRRKLEEELND
jgi:hypothetical protein